MAYTSILTLTPYNSTTNSTTPITIQVESLAFDVEQVLNIGSQSSGAGAGKITFNPFSITKLVDVNTPLLFLNAASGTPFQTATLTITMPSAAHPYLVFTFKLVAVKTLAVAGSQHGGPLMETVTFEYGGLQVRTYAVQPNGTSQLTSASGWNRVSNTIDVPIQ